MTQKILGKHSEIFTTSEPWILLHPFFSLRDEGYQAEYDAHFARVGLDSFLELLPGGQSAYLSSLAQLYKSFYHQVALAHGKKLFLDKTPRYYYIIPELAQAFQQSSFIILLRNPLAVLCSLVSTWMQGRWLGLRAYKHDLLKAPYLLLDGIDYLGDRAIVLNYEQLLKHPSQEIELICQKLDLEFTPSLLEYGDHTDLSWAMGDKKSVDRYISPDTQNSDRWISELENNPQLWRLANDYLEFLGPEIIHRMSYDYEKLRNILNKRQPSQLRLLNTMSLDWVLKEPTELASFNYGYLPIKIMNLLQLYGPFRALKILANKLSVY